MKNCPLSQIKIAENRVKLTLADAIADLLHIVQGKSETMQI